MSKSELASEASLQMLHGKIFQFLIGYFFILISQVSIGKAPDSWPNVQFKHPLKTQDFTLGIVRTLYQDRQGFIWIGGETGLVRYDGYDYTIYQHDPNDPTSISFNVVRHIVEDSLGRLWIATEQGINRFDRKHNRFKRYLLNAKNLDANAVRRISPIEDGNLWLATFGGAAFYNSQSDSFRVFRHDPEETSSLIHDHVFTSYVDRRGDAWFGTEKGLSYFDGESQSFKHFSPKFHGKVNEKFNVVRSIYEDSLGNFWVGTNGGLTLFDRISGTYSPFIPAENGESKLGAQPILDIHEDKNKHLWIATDSDGLILLDPKSKHFEKFTHEPTDISTISSNVVRAVIEDNQGDLWFGLFPTGVDLFDRSTDGITVIKAAPNKVGHLNHNSILSILEEDDGNLWLGTDGGGLNYFDRSKGQFTAYTHDADDPKSISANAVLSLVRDSEGYIWVTTWGGGVNRFDPIARTFKRYLPDPENKLSISSPYVWMGMLDSRGDLWFGTTGGGLNRYDPKLDEFIHYRHDENNPTSIAHDMLWSIYEDKQGNFWVGTHAGLNLMDRDKGTFTHFRPDNKKPNSLTEKTVWSIYEDSLDQLWIGTRLGLNRMDRETASFTSIRQADGFANEDIRSIVEDSQGYLWLGTNKNLSRIRLSDGHIDNFTSGHWLQGGFKNNSAVLLRTGELAFGSAHGFTFFNPKDVRINTKVPPIVITRFDIFNNPVDFNDPHSPLDKPIGMSESLILNYKQSVFSFSFSALSYRNSNKNQYAYMLEGFDQNWNYVGSQRRATYTNLDAGQYVFRVKGSNEDGYWNEQGAAIKITILPPPWRTWWAYTIYVLLAAGLLAWFVYAQRKKVHEAQAKFELEKSVSQRLIHLDKVKDDLLANTSHELRTPLNGIIGISETLMDGAAGPLDDIVVDNLRMISSSGKRLASLVNDILDFSKLKNEKLHIEKKSTDFCSLAEMVVRLSQPLVKDKTVELINATPKDLPPILADENRLQQILFNLIGNAIKFTETGSVTINATVKNEALLVSIQDTGIGISSEKFESIFEAFEQVEDHESRSYGGTGLGLAVTKKLVEMHDGKITVESKVGDGSTFIFDLPLSGEAAQNKSEQSAPVSKLRDIESKKIENITEEESETLPIPEKENLKPNFNIKDKNQSIDLNSNSKFRVLIVDDEAINRQVLVNQLSLHNYQITEACSGIEALKIIEESEPFNLILLDIMMPRMSGYEVCSRLREKYEMHELPIIFLTAKNLITDLEDGFDVGANDFLTKPIAKGELTSRVRTHLQLYNINQNLEEIVIDRTQQVQMANQELTSLDDIVSNINREVNFDDILQVLIREATNLISNAEYALYWDLDKKDDFFHCVISERFNSQSDNLISLSREDLLATYVRNGSELGEGVYLTEFDPEKMKNSISKELGQVKSAASILVEVNDELTGLLVLENTQDAHAFDEVRLDTLARFRSHAISAFSKASLMTALKEQNIQLEEASMTDQLTGLRNRRYIYKWLQEDISLSLRNFTSKKKKAIAPPDAHVYSDTDIIFFVIDIDHFKHVNDTYGHMAGDEVLVQIKVVLESVFRKSDYIVRWGGEEFLIVARSCDREGATFIAERLRCAMEAHKFDLGNGLVINKTCSIGFSCFPFLAENPEHYLWLDIVNAADHCLMAAKRTSRNAWIGMCSGEKITEKCTITEIIENTNECINSGKICIITSIENSDSIIWNE